jgi:hypothetical protein
VLCRPLATAGGARFQPLCPVDRRRRQRQIRDGMGRDSPRSALWHPLEGNLER